MNGEFTLTQLPTLNKSHPVQTKLQKAFGEPKSIKEYKRFQDEKYANSGKDPSGKFFEFYKKDIIKPLVRDSLYDHYKANTGRNERWALQTDKLCYFYEKVPKFEKYKDYRFPIRDKAISEKYKAYVLPTDHISVQVSEKGQLNSTNNSFQDFKGQYNVQCESKNGWAPRHYMNTTTNSSSVNYNIISFNKDKNRNTDNLSDINQKKKYHIKKSICEFSDLSRTYRTNFNPSYRQVLEKNPKLFYNYKGIFTNLYDASHRNGDISVPFRQNKENKTIQSKTSPEDIDIDN